ncbi:E3 ubiquitin ligase [Kickxella alabastrina]|uniref:E3 ubiquitin ligase n=1 Tax=Kickxella alabastrina TaxID=61397 RepID=A0ACC1IQM9_9FUNG|nr:E3 ubiquitin ligase [Kickxella alabastrina]
MGEHTGGRPERQTSWRAGLKTVSSGRSGRDFSNPDVAMNVRQVTTTSSDESVSSSRQNQTRLCSFADFSTRLNEEYDTDSGSSSSSVSYVSHNIPNNMRNSLDSDNSSLSLPSHRENPYQQGLRRELQSLQENNRVLRVELAAQNIKLELSASVMAHIENSLACSICMDAFTYPHSLACGHTFCQECLLSWLLRNKKCPVCRVPVIKQPAVAYVVQDITACLNTRAVEGAPTTPSAESNVREGAPTTSSVRSNARVSNPWARVFPPRLASDNGIRPNSPFIVPASWERIPTANLPRSLQQLVHSLLVWPRVRPQVPLTGLLSKQQPVHSQQQSTHSLRQPAHSSQELIHSSQQFIHSSQQLVHSLLVWPRVRPQVPLTGLLIKQPRIKLRELRDMLFRNASEHGFSAERTARMLDQLRQRFSDTNVYPLFPRTFNHSDVNATSSSQTPRSPDQTSRTESQETEATPTRPNHSEPQPRAEETQPATHELRRGDMDARALNQRAEDSRVQISRYFPPVRRENEEVPSWRTRSVFPSEDD